MKVSLVSLAVAATALAPAHAYPSLLGDLAKGLTSGMNLFGNSSSTGLFQIPGLDELKSIVQNTSPAQIQALTDNIKWGIGNVTQLASEQGIDIPKAPASILGAKWGSLQPEDIYKAFNIDRTAMANTTKRGFFLGEDDAHPYQPPDRSNPDPTKWDQRGPCPGLNTLANHGYLPRNGLVNPVQMFIGTFLGLNLSPDLCAILVAIAYVWKGDLLRMTLSIGGQADGYLGGGLSSYGVLEGHGSITRDDAILRRNEQGKVVRTDGWSPQRERINEFKQESGSNISPLTLSNSRKRAWNWSVKNNPQFDFNPWRMLVAYGESGFTMEVLRGKSWTFDNDMIEDWFWTERFPPGWSRRWVPMSTPEILAWAGIIEALNPTIPGWSIGGIFIGSPFESISNALGGLFGSGQGNLLGGAFKDLGSATALGGSGSGTSSGLSGIMCAIVGPQGWFGALTGWLSKGQCGDGAGNAPVTQSNVNIGSIQGIGCDLSNALLGWLPTQFNGLVDQIGVGGINGLVC